MVLLIRWWPGVFEELLGGVDDGLAVGSAGDVPVLGPILPFADPADERLQLIGVVKFVPALHPDQPAGDFGRQLTIDDQTAPPPDELPACVGRMRRQRGGKGEFVDYVAEQVVCFKLLVAPKTCQPDQ